MVRFALVLSCVVGLSVAASSPASAALLTFENIATTCCAPVPVPDGYADFSWSNEWRVLDGRDYGASGFQNGTVSGKNVLTAPGGDWRFITSSRPFTAMSLYATAAWSDDLALEVFAFRDGVAVSGYIHPINVDTPLLVELPSPPLGFDGIDQLGFFAFGGLSHRWADGHTTSGEEFVIDNLQFSFDHPKNVPEPFTGVILLSALAGWAVIARRRESP